MKIEMNKKDLQKVITLSDFYTLKGSFSKQYLFDLRTMKRFLLDAEQFQFLSLCTGDSTLTEIIKEYDTKSQKIIFEFVGFLKKIKAIEFKKERKQRRFLDLVKNPRLRLVHFEITGNCNMKCVHCYQKKYLHQPQNEISFKEIQNLILEMRKLQVEEIGISGGEPFMRTDIFDIIKFFEDNEIAVSSIFTNGLLLNKKIIENLLKCRSNFSLFVSLDAIKPDSMKFRGFNSIQGKKVLQRALKNIRIATEAGIPISVNTMVTKENIKDIYQMYDYLREIGVKGWRLGVPKRTGNFRECYFKFALSWEEVLDVYLKIIQYHTEIEQKLQQDFNFQIEYLFRKELFENIELLSENAYVCDYEEKRQSCCIKPNGDVTSCAFYPYSLGNIRKYSLETIWYSKEMQNIKNVSICDVKDCQSCSLGPLCATGCRANAIFLHDSANAKDDDACIAVKFFVEKVFPFLKKKEIIKKKIKV